MKKTRGEKKETRIEPRPPSIITDEPNVTLQNYIRENRRRQTSIFSMISAFFALTSRALRNSRDS